MFLKVDYREKELQNKISYYISCNFNYKDIKVVVENLPIGDVIITNNNEDVIIIERKTISDLLSSIKDGRYQEQSFRLDGNSVHNHNIIYLIEGDINKNMFKDNTSEKVTLFSAIFSLNYYKGFSVIRTFSIDETALFICNCYAKYIKGLTIKRTPFYSNKHTKEIKDLYTTSSQPIQTTEENQTTQEHQTIQETDTIQENQDKNYINVVKKIKKENITKDNIDELMLCQIPGISNVTAVALIKHFGNLVSLIEAIKINNDCLTGISYTNEKNQNRKITKTSIENLITFLLKK